MECPRKNNQKVEKLYRSARWTLRNRQSIWEYQFGPLGSKRGFHRSFHHGRRAECKDIEKRLEKIDLAFESEPDRVRVETLIGEFKSSWFPSVSILTQGTLKV